MRQVLMKLVAKTFLTWLSKKLPPSGQPFLHVLEADCLIVIEAMPDGIGPRITSTEKLTEEKVKDIIEWTLGAIRNSHSGEEFVALLTYVLGILEIQALPDLMLLLAASPSIVQTSTMETIQQISKEESSKR